MIHVTGDCDDVYERLRAYAQMLDLDDGHDRIKMIPPDGGTLAQNIELFRKQLSANFGGDFLAYRLQRGFAANAADFRQPVMERQRLPSALLRHSRPVITD